MVFLDGDKITPRGITEELVVHLVRLGGRAGVEQISSKHAVLITEMMVDTTANVVLRCDLRSSKAENTRIARTNQSTVGDGEKCVRECEHPRIHRDGSG